MTNNLTHYKIIILNNDYYKFLYNIEIIILIGPKITLENNFDYKWMCSWSVIESEMKLGHDKFGSLLTTLYWFKLVDLDSLYTNDESLLNKIIIWKVTRIVFKPLC